MSWGLQTKHKVYVCLKSNDLFFLPLGSVWEFIKEWNEWNGMIIKGMEWNEIEWNGFSREMNGMEWNGM